MEPLQGIYCCKTILVCSNTSHAIYPAGRVEWSTWGSKLESIFAPIFATLPSVMVSSFACVSNQDQFIENGLSLSQASQLTTTCDTPLSILLPNGLSKAELNRWRDAVSYTVVGKLILYDQNHMLLLS